MRGPFVLAEIRVGGATGDHKLVVVQRLRCHRAWTLGCPRRMWRSGRGAVNTPYAEWYFALAADDRDDE